MKIDLRNLVTPSNVITLILQESQKKEREGGAENLLEEVIVENFPDLGTETDIQIQQAQRIPNKINKSRPTPRHITIKMAKYSHKEKTLQAARQKKTVTYKGNTIK